MLGSTSHNWINTAAGKPLEKGFSLADTAKWGAIICMRPTFAAIF